MSRRVIPFFVAVALSLGGCATLDDWLPGAKKTDEARSFEGRPVLEPIDANVFTLHSPDQAVVGEPQVVFATAGNTLSDFARAYGLGYDEVLAANPGVDAWLPGENTPILLPTQFVLPSVEKRGIVLNIASKRLFYFPEPADGEMRQVLTFPIGIGRVGWETPLGETSVVAKAKDPSWWVPASVRKEHAEMGDPLPSVVPPGPDNPLGHRVLKLGMPGYLIHGTNQPYGVGMRVSHGCVRLYPENIEYLYTLVDIGVPVTIVNEPYQIGVDGDAIYFEAHEPLEDDTVAPEDRLQALLASQTDRWGEPLRTRLQNYIAELSADTRGLAINAAMYDSNELIERVRVVENLVEANPDEYTLEEIREMMSELEAESSE